MMSSIDRLLCSSSTSSGNMEPLGMSVQFKSGAVYTGSVGKDGKTRSGRGTFSWPSGLRYSGEFSNNKRHGEGVQVWPDGSKYEGGFEEDLRHGHGRHIWQNGEEYEGMYCSDKRQGHGRYRWPSGAHFCGHFHNDHREGVGVYVSPEGEKFEGVYHHDRRDGEGVLTYPGGRQDVGTWKGVKLVRLRFTVASSFFDPSSANPLGSPNLSLVAGHHQSRGREFGPKGPLEMISEELLQSASEGNVAKVDAILKSGAAHVDVVDRAGHSALFAAAVHSRTDVLHILLDSGADVNLLDGCGISALNACYHVEYAARPEVQSYLSRLPSLKSFRMISQCSSPSTFTERTLHTCDLFSPPGSANHCPAFSSQLCLPQSKKKSTSQLNALSSNALSSLFTHQLHLSDKGALKSRSQGHLAAAHQLTIATLSPAKSFPTLSSLAEDERRVRFTHTNADSHTPSHTSKEENTLQLEKAKDVRGDVIMTSLPIQSFTVVTPLADGKEPAATSNPPPRLEVELTSSPSLSTSDIGSIANADDLPATASALGGEEDILGVSALSGDYYSTSVPPEEEGGGGSRMDLLSQLSNVLPDDFGDESSLISFGRQSEATPTPSLVGNDEMPLSSTAVAHINPSLHHQSLEQLTRRSSFSFSPQYGSIVSAAQSTSLSCAGSEDTHSETSLTSSSPSLEVDGRLVPVHTPRNSISVLLMRGADPNICTLPFPPLCYAILAGDLDAVRLLLRSGASTQQWIQLEVEGHYPLHLAVSCLKPNSVAIVSSLLEHGADPNCEEHVPASDRGRHLSGEERGEGGVLREAGLEREEEEEAILDECLDSELVDSCLQREPVVGVAGENQGSAGYTPLHLVCSTDTAGSGLATPTPQEMVTDLLVAMVKLLIAKGANVNKVAKGHSPLSLAIVNGHTKVIDVLLEGGADPNLPLGRGVATALCSLTTHAAIKKRDLSTSLTLVSQLLSYGADVFQSVRIPERADSGIILDFAHEAFKQDKRLACLKYHSLTKTERSRYRTAKKIHQHFTDIYKCSALQTIAAKEESWLSMQKKGPPVPYLDLPAIGSTGHHKLYRTTSMCDSSKYQPAEMRSPRKRNKGRSVMSAGGRPRTKPGYLSLSLPEHTLRAALENLSKAYGNEGAEPDISDDERDGGTNKKTAAGGGKNELGNNMNIEEMFEKAKSLFPSPPATTKDNLNDEDSPVKKEWTMFSFCYECGRTSGVHLVKCPGCKGVSYCSKTCRSDNWKKGHQKECTGAQVKHASGGKGRGGPYQCCFS